MKTNGHSFTSKPLSMVPLISTGKHPQSDGISLSTCPEAPVVPSIAAGMGVCFIIQVHNIHQRIVRAQRMFGVPGRVRGKFQCVRESGRVEMVGRLQDGIIGSGFIGGCTED